MVTLRISEVRKTLAPFTV